MGFFIDSTASVADVSDITAPIEVTWLHTIGVPRGTVLIAALGNNGAGNTATSVVRGGQSFTKLRAEDNAGAGAAELWYLVNPRKGAFSITATYSGNITANCGASVAFGGLAVGETVVDSSNWSQADAADAISTSITTITENVLLVDVLFKTNATGAPVVDGGQTQVHSIAGTSLDLGVSYKLIGAPGVQSMGWNDNSNPSTFSLAHVVIGLKIGNHLGFNQNRLRPSIFTPGRAL